MAFSPSIRALHILRSNIQALLLKRHESEATLAAHLGFKHRSSLNKFLTNQRSGFQMWRLDRMAEFFGLPVYQLFQPGISPLMERRVLKDRRMGIDRRHAHKDRLGHVPTPHPPRHRRDGVAAATTEEEGKRNKSGTN